MAEVLLTREMIDELMAEDPDDRADRMAHGFSIKDDWQDPTVVCRNGCGLPYSEVVAGKIRRCEAVAEAGEMKFTGKIEFDDLTPRDERSETGTELKDRALRIYDTLMSAEPGDVYCLQQPGGKWILVSIGRGNLVVEAAEVKVSVKGKRD